MKLPKLLQILNRLNLRHEVPVGLTQNSNSPLVDLIPRKHGETPELSQPERIKVARIQSDSQRLVAALSGMAVEISSKRLDDAANARMRHSHHSTRTNGETGIPC